MKKQTRGAPLVASLLCINITISVVALTGCVTKPSTEPVSVNGTYFDTLVQISMYEYTGKSGPILDGCLDLCEKYENLFSATVEGSDIWNINHASAYPVEVSSETATLLQDAIDICEISNGKLDITIGEIASLWDFSEQSGSDNPKLPDSDKLQEALTHVGYENIVISSSSGKDYVSLLDSQAQIELGFIAKGYIADRLKDYLTSEGVTSAMINLGGNVYALGQKSDGNTYTIAIQKPFGDMGEYLDVVHVRDLSVVSSGIYERYFKKGNNLYHHILDPQTGFPVQNNIYEISIICSSSEKADALSTLCFVLGTEEGIKYIESLDNTECMYITSDYQMISSSGWESYR